jgi:hypothetical protein
VGQFERNKYLNDQILPFLGKIYPQGGSASAEKSPKKAK